MTAKKKSSKIIITGSCLLLSNLLLAQYSVNSSGGTTSGASGSFAYSIGQVFYGNSLSGNVLIEQEVQHAYDVLSVGIPKTELNVSLKVFPNPTSDNLTIEIDDYKNEKLYYRLYDTQGKLLLNEEIKTIKTNISTIALPSATYIIEIVDKEAINIQTFKVVKY